MESDQKIEIEGLDDRQQEQNYPIDSLLIRNETRTIHDVLRRIEKGSFIMNPDFQRDFVWPEDKQSKLIESVLMRIPLPVFYLAEDENGRMVVVDGLQRLSTFQRFVNNKLSLKLPSSIELDKKLFSVLSPKLQNRIEDCNLILYIIDAKVPEKIRLDIFERVNGGVPLSRQQMRNCIYMGQATQFLKDEANTEIFKQATGGSLKSETMRDRECVNRFCAFKILSLSEYKGDMDSFLALSLKKMNLLPPNDIERLSLEFRRSLRNNFTIFGTQAFRKISSDGSKRNVFNASLWDIMSTGFSNYPEHVIEAQADALREGLMILLEDHTFQSSITLGTSQLNRVKERFEKFNTMIQEVLGDYTA